MADLVMGAMPSIISKLYQLLEKEYNLQAGVTKRITSLTKELESAQAVLRKVAQVPWDQLDEQVQIWARQVREASYDMEDILDIFLVRVQVSDSAEQESLLKRYIEKITKWWSEIMAQRKISCDVKDILSHLEELTERYRRYKVDEIVARPATASTVDPRLHAMYARVDKLVGIDKSSGELKSMLQLDDMSNTKMKTVSIVGIGGLGKTTLAKAVYDNPGGDFNCKAFVSVGRKPDLQKVLQMILIALDTERYKKFNFAVLQDITQFIDELREFLHDKRYFIVIDDLWEKLSWEPLKLAIADEKSCKGRIIITTRKLEVANNADEVYELPPLPHDSSRKLFYTRIYGDEIKSVDYQQPDQVSDEILRKCAGIPLAVITMASLLVHEPKDKWFEVYKSIGFGCKDNEDEENVTKKILSFSYYDLSSHLRTCLLYLSAFPEDSVIPKHSLVWMWAAEGFIPKREGKGLFETGEGYFNDLINRSLIQEVDEGNIHGCRLHDMVLDFVLSISCEENFFTVFDNNDQGTLVPGNVVRRLARHKKTMVLSNQANMFDMSKVRSFIALDRDIDDTWAPLSSFELLRVLNIEYYDTMTHSHIRVEPLRHLHHLRFLGIKGRVIQKIPEEIGYMKTLQTLDLIKSYISELPSSSSLPTQLVCLRINLSFRVHLNFFSVGRLTSLEELSIELSMSHVEVSRRLVKELGSLRELRVLDAHIPVDDVEMERDLTESVRHLHKLQHLKIRTFYARIWESEMEFVLPGDLRYLGLPHAFIFWKLPSCIDHLCHRKLSHLGLSLRYMDEEELKTLGRLPDLRFLELDLEWKASPTIHNINDSNVCYFPKLRCLRLPRSMLLFVANKGDDGKKTVSFHIWNGEVDESITMPPSVSDSELQLQGDDESSSVFQWETGRGSVGEKSDDELQLLSVSDDVHTSRRFFQPPFLKKRRLFQPSKLQHGIAMPPVSDEEKKKSTISRDGDGEGAATPRFMPRLQVLHFRVPKQTIRDHPTCCDNLGLEFLSSLQEINIGGLDGEDDKVKAVLRRAAQVHPNRPTLRIER